MRWSLGAARASARPSADTLPATATRSPCSTSTRTPSARLANELKAHGSSAFGAEVDVSDRAAVDRALGAVRSALGPVEIMVTSAGIERFEDFVEVSAEDWDRMIAVNLTGTFHCLQSAVPDMLAAGWGRIVTISSSAAQSGTNRMSSYVASKGGVIGLTKALAIEYAPRGITVNTIPPGFIDTPMMRRSFDVGRGGRHGRSRSPGHRSAGRARPRTSRRPAPSCARSRPATSPVSSSA